MALTVDDLFASPDHYLHSLDGDRAIFVPMDRAAYHRSIFLDQRISPAADASLPVPVAALTGSPREAAPTSWIFHVAHCGSTLLARALDAEDRNLVLREPLALRQAAVSGDAARLGLILPMLSKRYEPSLPTLVKANVPVNFALPAIARADPQARAILLHLGWRDYLPAILRSDNHRGWLRRVTVQLGRHLPPIEELGDGELAAALWFAQTRAFARATAAMPNARWLDAETFFADPAPVLERAARHLRIDLTPAGIAERVAGPLFATYSKNPLERFDNEARIARRKALEAGLGAELERAERWLAKVEGEVAQATARLAAASL